MNAFFSELQTGNVVILEVARERLLLDISHISDSQSVAHVEAGQEDMADLLDHLSKIPDKKTGQIYNHAMSLLFSGRYERAMELLESIRDAVLQENDCLRILYLFHNIGTIARLLGDYQTAFRHFMDYLTLDRFYRNERSGVSFKDLLLTIDFSAKGKELLDIIEQDSHFEYSSFDTLLMKISYYEKLEKYQYVEELLPKAKKFLLFEQDIKKKIYYYFMLIHLHTTTGIGTPETVQETLNVLESAIQSDIPHYYRIKIFLRLFLYYIKINDMKRQLRVLNRFKKLPATSENRIPFFNTLAHFYYVRQDYKKAAACYVHVMKLSDETEERLMSLSTRMLYYNILRILNDHSFLESLDTEISFDIYLKYNMRSEYSRTTVNFAVLLGEIGEFAKAIGYLRKVVSISAINNHERFRCIAAFNEAYYSFLSKYNEKDCVKMFIEAEKSLQSVSHYQSYMMLLSSATSSYLYDYPEIFQKSMVLLASVRHKFDYSHDPLHEEILTAIMAKKFTPATFYESVRNSNQGLTYALMHKATDDMAWHDSWKATVQSVMQKVPFKFQKGYASALLEYAYMDRISPLFTDK